MLISTHIYYLHNWAACLHISSEVGVVREGPPGDVGLLANMKGIVLEVV